MSARDEHPALPPALAQLEAVATAADAQLDGVALLPGQEPAPEPDETAEVAGMLTLIAVVASKAMPPIGEAYTPEACNDIAMAYMRCVDAYGWTFHKQLSSPVAGLIAAAAMPAVLNIDKFSAYVAERKAQARRAASSSSTSSATPAPAPAYSPSRVGA